jgi:CBS domain-containing protein
VVVTTDDETHRPLAIITETHITRAVADGRDVNETRIDELISPDPMVAEPGMTATEAAAAMLAMHIRHLPIVEDGRLLGIVDISDVCRALLEEVPVSP